jgi:hypothetical protein
MKKTEMRKLKSQEKCEARMEGHMAQLDVHRLAIEEAK